MLKFVWNGIVANVMVPSAFKRNAINIKLDDSEDHLVKSKLKALIWDDILDFRQKLLSSPHPLSLKKMNGIMIPSVNLKTYGKPKDLSVKLAYGKLLNHSDYLINLVDA